jgi:hypothetical protein
MRDRTLRLKCLSSESSAPSVNGPKTTDPALFTRTSSRPPKEPREPGRQTRPAR